MKCFKCKHDLQEEDKFCPKCGEETLRKDEDIIGLVKKSFGTWFTVGREYGILEGKEDKKGMEDFEENMRKIGLDDFFEALAFSRTHKVTKFNEDKKEKASQNRKAQ